MEERQRGWGWPVQSRRAHYFVGTRALCGRWGLYMGHLEAGNDNSPDNCAACKRKLAALRAKEKEDPA